jgi:pilus assembly protein CpaB
MVLRLALFLLLVVALIAVSVFGLSILNSSKTSSVASAPQQTEQVLVASGLLSAGALLQPSDISSSSVDVNAVPDGASLDTPANRSDLIGSMIRSPISPGAPILASAVIPAITASWPRCSHPACAPPRSAWTLSPVPPA